MGRVRRQTRHVKEKNPHLDAKYYEQLYTDKELMPSLFRISASTEKEVNRTWEIWKKYCALRASDSDPLQRLCNISVADLRRYMHWYLDKHNIKKLDTFYVRMRYWRMMYARKMYEKMDHIMAAKMKSFISTVLRVEYDLSETAQVKPTMSHALLILLMAYTSARPGALVEGSGYYNTGDCLKYKDIEIFKVRDPECPSRNILIMTVILRIMKGKRNKGSPEWINCPEDLQTFQVPSHLQSLPLQWKESMLEIPVFRRAVSEGGQVITSPTKALQYATIANQNLRLGKSTGFKDPFRFYCLRRGAANAINKITTTAERNQIMGHSRAEIYDKYYINQVVGTYTQSAYLGTPSKDALINLAGHMNLTRDPEAPNSIRPDLRAVKLDPEVQALEDERAQLRADIIAKFGSIKSAAGTALYDDYCITLADLRSRKEQVRRLKLDKDWQGYFNNSSIRHIDEQRRGIAYTYTEVTPTFIFEERERLASLLCQNRDVMEMSEYEVYENRLNALQDIISLCGRREAPRQVSRQAYEESTEEDPDPFPISCLGTQCLFYLGESSLCHSARTFSFSHRDALIRHVSGHLRTRDWSKNPSCPHPVCKTKLDSEMHFKNHAAIIHNIKL
ncbi:MAG: hypothetical protein M1840_003006 [Geoglossum simile]|nr:MAG: hypothetical protein M1840_003006 [Geoglossum simile]